MLIEVIRTESLKIYNRSSINQVRTWAFTLIHYSVLVSPITLENWNICAAICFRVLKLRTMLLSIFLDEWSCWLNGQWLGGTMWCKYHFLLTDVFTRNCASSLVYRFVNMNMIRFRSRKKNEMSCFWALKIKKNCRSYIVTSKLPMSCLMRSLEENFQILDWQGKGHLLIILTSLQRYVLILLHRSRWFNFPHACPSYRIFPIELWFYISLKTIRNQVMGTLGYAAPDYIETGHLTTKSDVWSFGVVLYEILTGRRSMERNRPKNEQKLLEWVRQYPVESKQFSKIIDTRLEGHYSKQGARKVAKLANSCLAKHRRDRPTMREVVKSLKQAMQHKELDGDAGASGETSPPDEVSGKPTTEDVAVASARRRMLHLAALGENANSIAKARFMLMRAAAPPTPT